MGIRFFEKSKIDLTLGTKAVITVTDAVATDNGQAYVDYMRNRRNSDGWSTTGSTDAASTTLVVQFGDLEAIDSLFLFGINWKSYTAKYWDGVAYQDFSTPINETANATEDKFHSFNAVETSQIRIIITATMNLNDDKYCTQMVPTQSIGTFTMQPLVQDNVSSKNRKLVKTLSGKSRILRTNGFFEFSMKQKCVVNDTDLTLLESLFDYYDGFLVWLNGGDSTQFRTNRIGFRTKDLYFMNVVSEYKPEWNEGFYKQGTNIDAKFSEVI
jgi:hypothetical protein